MESQKMELNDVVKKVCWGLCFELTAGGLNERSFVNKSKLIKTKQPVPLVEPSSILQRSLGSIFCLTFHVFFTFKSNKTK